MTTEITRVHNPKLPPLPAYRDHVDRILAPKPTRPLYRLLILPVLLALWLWPGWTLATVCIGGPVALLGWFLWSARQDAKEYNEEHGLKPPPRN